MEVTPSSEPLDLHTIRSQINELTEIHSSSKEDATQVSSSNFQLLANDFALHLESKVKEIISEFSDVGFLGIEDLDAYKKYLEEELKAVTVESAKISTEVEALSRTHLEDYNKFESDLEGLKDSLDLIALQGVEKANEVTRVDCSTYVEDHSDSINAHGDNMLEILELQSQIEKNNLFLKSLQDLDFTFKRFDVIDQVEDIFTGLKVVEFDGNCIRLSLCTYVRKLEDLLYQQKIDDVAYPSELNHELRIEVMDGTTEIKNVEMFPDDVYIGDIIDSAKSFRQLSSQSRVLERSSLEWFVGKVQDRIILITMRRFVVKNANKLRHSFEFVDRDETIIAHLVGEIDAFIKVSQGWPLSKSPLKLISVKGTNHHSKGLSLSLCCKVEELANSLNENTRQSLSSFVDGIEKVLVEQMQLEVHPDYPYK
ncbi:hypothetical protein CFOL_v3_06040 [Cephalotus follicularis]|uniref:Uncharacterized protein n=1 Tax=Cephalotus follicularis TaxID=3775 RepID=A0A1Q3B3E3_CEPFO|nr:hypothetical protein CFOL_v3_06040 [Cephalotus follicularis]